MLKEQEIYNLCQKAHASLCGDKIIVDANAPAEVVEAIDANKAIILDYLAGYCFKVQLELANSPLEWVVAQKSTWGDAMYPPIEVFCGTAREVDLWCREHKDDPLFTDDYMSKYTIYHR